MLSVQVHARRRQALMARVQQPVLLMGNGVRTRNLPMNALPFRQDSTFLYLTGCELPGAAALLQGERCTLFTPAPAEDDDLWHGTVHTLEEYRQRYGVDEVRDAAELEQALQGVRPLVLAVADEERNRLASSLVGIPLRFGREHGHDALVDAIIELRRVKEPVEIEEIRRAARVTRKAHTAVMAATRPGVHERQLTALYQAVLASHGCAHSFDTILSMRGEVLHNPFHDQELEAGRLLLVDAGAETETGYAADVTRAWPVSGRFTPRQRAAYEAVLAAEEAAMALCKPGVRYRKVHDQASLVLARWLADEGLLEISPEDAVEQGAHALFFPHGVGHLLGMDVHDLENFGDRPAYPPGQGRSEPFGTCYLRLDLPLEEGWVVTIEPGFYAVPAILERPVFRQRFAGIVDFDKAMEWVGFGGIRIEDDALVTAAGPENLTLGIPKTVAEVEAVVGSRPELLSFAE